MTKAPPARDGRRLARELPRRKPRAAGVQGPRPWGPGGGETSRGASRGLAAGPRLRPRPRQWRREPALCPAPSWSFVSVTVTETGKRFRSGAPGRGGGQRCSGILSTGRAPSGCTAAAPPQAPRRGRRGPRVTRGGERGRRRGQSRCAEWHLLPGPLPVAAASLPACGGSGRTRGASSVPPSGEAWGPRAAPARKPDSEAQSGEEDARFLDCPVITNYPFWEWPLCLKSHFPPSVVHVFELFVLCTLLKKQNSGPFCCMPVTRHRASGASSRPPWGGGGGSAAPQSDASS